MHDIRSPTPNDISADAQSGLGVVPGLLWAFRIHQDGAADALAIEQPIDNRHDGWLWLHLDLADGRAMAWLRSAKLPAPAVTMMLGRDRHQQLHTMGSYIYGIFADMVRRIDGVSDETGHLRFVMTERMLISGRHHALCSVEAARTAIEGNGRRLTGVAALLELIVEHVAEAIDRIADDLGTELDGIEDSLARRADKLERQKLAAVRRTSVRVHRQLSGLRAVFHRLERQGNEDVERPLQIAAGKLAQRLDALDHDVLELRERGHRLQEEVSAMMTEESNRHLHVLSILTTLLLPPTLIAGIFGMNTKGLPFADDESGFLWAMVLVVVSSIAVYAVMRRIGIFKTPW
ncbi:MAG: zinc transporter [Hyphomicrobiales bacterium]